MNIKKFLSPGQNQPFPFWGIKNTIKNEFAIFLGRFVQQEILFKVPLIFINENFIIFWNLTF